MIIRELFFENEQSANFLFLFQKGEQKAMDYIYKRSFDSLLYFGKTFINDEFLVICILHECYITAWDYREKMESLPHIYRFIRMNLRWQILRHIEKSRNTIYGQTLYLDHIESRIGDFEDVIADKESWEEQIQMLKIATESIRYLSAGSQQVISLYFQKGLTHKQIANRLGKSTFQVADQLNKSIKQLKNIMNVSKQKIKNNSASGINFQIGILDCQQSKIYDLRKNHKLSFAEIATKLGLSQIQAQQHYIKAHQLIQKSICSKVK